MPLLQSLILLAPQFPHLGTKHLELDQEILGVGKGVIPRRPRPLSCGKRRKLEHPSTRSLKLTKDA